MGRMKTLVVLVVVVALTLFSSEVLARGRDYHPVQGRFTQRDPAGYVDGMSLYEYVQSAPTVGTDPSGAERDVKIAKWKECRCCCAEDLKITDIREWSPRKGKKHSLHHEFVLRAWLKYKTWTKPFKDCDIEWWEWPLRPGDPTPRFPKRAPEKTWTNMVKFVPDHDMWKGFYRQASRGILGNDQEVALIDDRPGLKKFVPELRPDHEQRLYFAIRVLSTEGCPCRYRWRSAYAHQEYLVEAGLVRRMHFEVRKIVPNNFLTQPDKPGLSPGWATTGGR